MNNAVEAILRELLNRHFKGYNHTQISRQLWTEEINEIYSQDEPSRVKGQWLDSRYECTPLNTYLWQLKQVETKKGNREQDITLLV